MITSMSITQHLRVKALTCWDLATVAGTVPGYASMIFFESALLGSISFATWCAMEVLRLSPASVDHQGFHELEPQFLSARRDESAM